MNIVTHYNLEISVCSVVVEVFRYQAIQSEIITLILWLSISCGGAIRYFIVDGYALVCLINISSIQIFKFKKTRKKVTQFNDFA